MDKSDIIKYWIEVSHSDYNTMWNLYNTGDYHWALFMGHLVIEKLLKAVYVQNIEENVPRIHDLLRLAEKAKLQLTERQQDMLDIFTTFNISARYPDYKMTFQKKCDQKFTLKHIKQVEELRTWLMSIIKPS